MPVALVLVSAGHSSTRSGGAVTVGGVVSRTVMVCRAEALLPQASVASQVRAMTLVPPQLLVTESLKVMITALQPSVAVAIPVALVPVSAGQSKVRLTGAVMVGGVTSRTVMVCKAEAVLPQPSVASQVRLITFVPPQLLLTASL